MATPMFVAYGAGDDVGHHVLLLRSVSSPIVTKKFAATWVSDSLGGFGSETWFPIGDNRNTSFTVTQLIDPDTAPPDQGGDNDFGISYSVGGWIIMPLASGKFVVAVGTYVYIQSPDDTDYEGRVYITNLVTDGSHTPVAISLTGSTVRIMYATRGNATKSARVLSFDVGAPPSGTVDATTLPTYSSTIAGYVPWQLDESAKNNWYTGLIPSVMGAFDYCVFRNADRSSDGYLQQTIGMAVSPPYASGDEMVVSGYQTQLNEFGSDIAFNNATFGGTMSGANLIAQTVATSPITTMTEVVAASGVSEFDYYFDAYRCGLALSFAAPPGPQAFWENIRLAVEVV